MEDDISWPSSRWEVGVVLLLAVCPFIFPVDVDSAKGVGSDGACCTRLSRDSALFQIEWAGAVVGHILDYGAVGWLSSNGHGAHLQLLYPSGVILR